MIKKGLVYVTAYLMWAVTLLLGLWLMILSRDGFLGLMAAVYVRDSITRAWQIRFVDKIFTIAIGILWLIFMIVGEAYFRKAAAERTLLKRFTKVTGVEILLVFAADLLLLLIQGSSAAGWIRWLIIGGELAIGMVFLVFAGSSRLPEKTISGQDR